jgi:hypothetical protein
LVMHLLLRPTLTQQMDLPGVEETCEVFADAFQRAVAVLD